MKYNAHYITKDRGDDMHGEAVQRQRSGKKRKRERTCGPGSRRNYVPEC